MRYFGGKKKILGMYTKQYDLVLYEHEKGWRIKKRIEKETENQVLPKDQGFEISDVIAVYYEKKTQIEKELSNIVPFRLLSSVQ